MLLREDKSEYEKARALVRRARELDPAHPWIVANAATYMQIPRIPPPPQRQLLHPAAATAQAGFAHHGAGARVTPGTVSGVPGTGTGAGAGAGVGGWQQQAGGMGAGAGGWQQAAGGTGVGAGGWQQPAGGAGTASDRWSGRSGGSEGNFR
jgi:hypothetical protein